MRIGIDELAGAAEFGDFVHAATELRSYRVSDFAELKDALCNDGLAVLDVRQRDEYGTGHLAGALNFPLHELIARMDEVPDREVWVHCASGYRSAIAASMLDRSGRTVVLINDDYDNAIAAGLATP